MSLLRVGDKAPALTVQGVLHGETADYSLSAYKGRWLVLFFYPADFTFVCPTEVLAFNAAVPAFDRLNAELLGVSTDGVYAHVAWMEFHIGKLDFPLASDRNQAVSQAYGVLDE